VKKVGDAVLLAKAAAPQYGEVPSGLPKLPRFTMQFLPEDASHWPIRVVTLHLAAHFQHHWAISFQGTIIQAAALPNSGLYLMLPGGCEAAW